jgi:hypothetical protein
MGNGDNVQKLIDAGVLDERVSLTDDERDVINGLSDQEVSVMGAVAKKVGDMSKEGEGSPWIL